MLLASLRLSTDYSLSMKTNKPIFTLLLLGFFSMFFSCDKDYEYSTEIRIENASQHDIEIIMPELWFDGSFFPEKIMLPRGQDFSHIIIGEGGFFGVPYFPSMQIRFDNDVSIMHVQSDGNTYHNFCNKQAYARSQPKKQFEVFTFVFTDEDYEYAKAHADKTK